jgi:uncharacterized protein YndB with AHSA1/START domain
MKPSDKPSVVHNTFVIERTYAATPERVFAAFSEKAAKAKWFGGPSEWLTAKSELDFRVGGRELVSGGPRGELPHTFDALYLDIVQNERIIYCYDMYVGERKLSVSLTTIELQAKAGGTALTFTEQGAFLGGLEDGSERESGTRALLEQLAAALAR